MNNKMELGGMAPEKNPEQTINELQQSFRDWLKESPEYALSYAQKCIIKMHQYVMNNFKS